MRERDEGNCTLTAKPVMGIGGCDPTEVVLIRNEVETDTWMTPAEARELATALLKAADLADAG